MALALLGTIYFHSAGLRLTSGIQWIQFITKSDFTIRKVIYMLVTYTLLHFVIF